MKRIMLSSACLILLVGCGGSSSTAKPTSKPVAASFQYRPAAANVPACAHAGKALAFPKTFPQNFPVPPGTALTGQRVPIGGGIAATGFVPSTSFKATVQFFPREVKRAGFKMLHLEVDAPHDSEGVYQGHGYVGGWALQAIASCPGAMRIQISAQKK